MSASPHRAGWLLLALTLLNVLNFADRYLLIGFSTAIIPELGLSNLQFGLLTGVVFTAVYTVLGVFAGSLADRVHRPRLIASGLTLWSALTAATGMAGSFAHMAAARVLIGVGEAGLTPAALSLLADRTPPERRAFASGVYYLGLPVGIGGSFVFAGVVGPLLGWRGSFMLLGALGIAAALLVVWLMRDPARSARNGPAVSPSASAQRGGSFSESFRAMAHALRTNTAFALTLFGVTAMVFAQGAAVLDLVWWVRERGYTLGEAQRLNGLVFLVGGVVGAVLGGAGADWAHRRYVAGRLKFLACAFLLGVPVAFAYRLVPGHSPLFLVLAFSWAVLGLLLYGPSATVVQELVPVQHRSSAVAMFLLFGALVGAGGGNATVGWLADVFTAAGHADPVTRAMLVTQGVGLLAAPALFLAARYQGQSLGEASVESTRSAAAPVP